MLTASEFLANVAANYATIEDYTATMVWTDETGTMRGALLYKRPNMIRIDFTQPKDQVIVSNGRVLQIYIPAVNVVLRQDLRGSTATVPGGLATAEGLALLRRNYTVAYLEGPEPVPFSPDSPELVTRLRLDSRQTTEAFRRLILSVDSEGLIRRIEGTRIDWSEVRMTLSDIRVNQRLSDQTFEYTPDPSASISENFLTNPEG